MQQLLFHSRDVAFAGNKGGRRGLFSRLVGTAGLVAGLCLAAAPNAFGQINMADENTDLWAIRGNPQHGIPGNNINVNGTGTGTWHGDSLWVGATFMRDTSKRFVVWLASYYTPLGSYHGALYL